MTIHECEWHELSDDEKKHIIDVRESSEIGPNDWKKVTDRGGEVLFYPLSRYRNIIPVLAEGRDYIISCAHGVRSRIASGAWSANRTGRLISLAGGYEAIRNEMS